MRLINRLVSTTFRRGLFRRNSFHSRLPTRSFSHTHSLRMGADALETRPAPPPGTNPKSHHSHGSKSPLWNPAPLNVERQTLWKDGFYEDDKNKIAQNACTKVDPNEACLSRQALEETFHAFTHKIDAEGKPVCNQKSSGRCWLFAFLNCVRIPFMKEYNLEEFEFSQSHLFFYDKLERCNYFLNNVVEIFKKGEPVDGRLMAFLLRSPIDDGGQFDMIVNLVQKYGLMPKKAFPESYSSEASARLNSILRSKLREYCHAIRLALEKGTTDTEVRHLLDSQMSEVFRIISICLGTPRDTFTYEYYDKSKAYHKIGPITPQQFYHDYVKPVYNIEDKVCLIHDPRPKNPYGRAYTVEYLGNIALGKKTIYNNQPMDLLLSLVAKQIKASEPVWFGCEVAKRFAGKQGIDDVAAHDYKSVFGTDVYVGLSKADRLIYGDSSMSHAMVFTACSLGEDGKITKLRVENSWGDQDRGEKGYIVMTEKWFQEFGFEVVIDKSHVSEDVLNVFEMEPIVLPAWDPMGSLACSNCSVSDLAPLQ